ncbi:MAG: hypothetical protein LBM27_01650 [Lactobacillaceae bacterium]|jgi:hypothetical protein|nr:hypothetical protein [Lactobacillaceae bacterium]
MTEMKYEIKLELDYTTFSYTLDTENDLKVAKDLVELARELKRRDVSFEVEQNQKEGFDSKSFLNLTPREIARFYNATDILEIPQAKFPRDEDHEFNYGSIKLTLSRRWVDETHYHYFVVLSQNGHDLFHSVMAGFVANSATSGMGLSAKRLQFVEALKKDLSQTKEFENLTIAEMNDILKRVSEHN